MREIKFRGRFWNKDNLDASECEYRDGEFIYGGYARLKNSIGTGDYIVAASGICHLVYPETVAQLICYDSNGREVYEGDKLTDGSGNSYIAVLETCVEWKNDSNDSIFRRMPIKFAKKFTKLTLVEAVA